MKNNHTVTIKTYQMDAQLEKKLEVGHSRLLETARKNGRHHALNNLPALIGDNLNNYTGELKAGYEKLGSEVLQALQPGTNLPESKVDADFYKAKVADLDKNIVELDKKNQDDRYTIEEFSPTIIRRRIQIALLFTGVILFGEVLFNTKAFQVTGENLLFAFFLSLCISFAVYLLSHAVPLYYKLLKYVWQRRVLIIVSLAMVTGLFTALAIFRSAYLEAHEIHIKPVYFVIINLFFFIVSTLVSFFVLPTWAEIKEHLSQVKIYRAIQRRTGEIEQMKHQKDEIKEKVNQKTIERIRILFLAKYVMNRIEKMYQEAVAIFKSTNMTFREDRKSPFCFNEPVGVIEVDEHAFTLLKAETK